MLPHPGRREALIVAIMATVAFLSGAQSVSVADSTGKTIALAKPAATILVLSRGARESLAAIKSHARMQGTGDAEQADLVACDPGSIDDIPASQKAAPVFIYDPRDFTELADAVMALGILTGNPSGGVKVAARLTASVNGVRRILSPINKKNYPEVFVELSTDPLETCGHESFLQSLVSEAGGKNICADRSGTVVTVCPEDVAQRHPRYIVSGEKTGTPWDSGAKQVPIDIDAAKSPGPGIASLLVKLAKSFHPGLIP